MGDVAKKFGKAVRKIREKKGYTQEEFADLIETERAYYGSIERGKHNLTLRKIERIVNKLGIKWAALFRELDK